MTDCYMHPSVDGTKEIRGIAMCDACYLLALEHSADFTFSAPHLHDLARRRLLAVSKREIRARQRRHTNGTR